MKSENYQGEISLIDLMKLFWQQKWLILISTVFCFGLSVAYLFFVKPIFEARANIIAPTEKDVFILNASRSNSNTPLVANLMVKDIYGIFSEVLTSDVIKQQFFEQVYLPSLTDKQRKLIPKDKLFHACFKKISIKTDFHVNPLKFTVIVNADDPSQTRKWVRQYIDLVEKRTVAAVVELITVQNMTLVSNIKKEIDEISEYETNSKLIRLAQFRKSLMYAKNKGIYDVSFNIILKDDLGLKLQKLKKEYNFYNNMSIPIEKIKVFRLDGVINAEDTPISPKVPLVLMLGLFTGFLMGCSLSLARNSL